MERKLHAVRVFDDGDLMIAHIHVGVERIVRAGPAGVYRDVGLVCAFVHGLEDALSAEARDARGAAFRDAAEDIEIVTNLSSRNEPPHFSLRRQLRAR